MASEEYEIRVFCDRKADSHHKGKDAHVTRVAYRKGWAQVESSWHIARSETKKRDPEEWLPISEDMDRVRYDLTCPRCGEHVTGGSGTVSYVLDRLMENGVHEISLRGLQAVLSRSDVDEHYPIL